MAIMSTREGSVSFDKAGSEIAETRITYLNKATGLVSQEEDLTRGLSALAAYDVYGRMLKLALPGYDLNNPTYQATYASFAANPQWVEVTEKLNPNGEGGTLTRRRFFSGLGEVIQEQAANQTVSVNGAAEAQYDLVTTFTHDQAVTGGERSSSQYVVQALSVAAGQTFRTLPANTPYSQAIFDAWGTDDLPNRYGWLADVVQLRDEEPGRRLVPADADH